MAERPVQVDRLKLALNELNANRAVFSPEAHQAMVMLLLNELRRANTLPPVTVSASDEIRLVTVVFVDVIDSTLLSQKVDAGDWKSIIAAAHDRVAAVVEQWDGQIGQYLGDGLLCFFGAQRSRGDDAMRAVSGALAVQATLNQYANEVFLEHGIEFATRTGISTGRVLVGMIGTHDRKELLALGTATNLANRLQSLAEPGKIVIDAATYSRVHNQFQMQQHPPASVKGFDRPVKYYTVLGRASSTTRELTTISLSGLPLNFAGREAELAQIRGLLENALINRRFHAITLVGETGIGKSRLLQEVLANSEELTFTPLVMMAAYEQRNTACNLLRDMLMTICGLSDDTSPEVAREQIRAFINGTWDDPEAEVAAAAMSYLTGFGADEDQRLQQMQQGSKDRSTSLLSPVVRWFRIIAEGGMLLLVENLQWADNASIRLLDAIARELTGTPSILIAAARPAYRAAHLLYLHGIPEHTVISLEPLSPESTGKIIEGVLSHIERAPAALQQVIVDRSEGNPLFVQEFLGMMFDNGVFALNSGRWRFNIVTYDSVAATLPHGLIGVLQARLDDLSPEARQIIQIAAVVGQVFWYGAIDEMTEINPQPLLETLVLRGMVQRHDDSAFAGETEFSFRHSLYRDVAYESIPRARREAYHRQVSRWLVTRISQKPEFYNILAEQFEASGEHETALYTWLEAVQNRLKRGLLTEGLTLNDRGLALARNVSREIALPVVSRLWALRGQALNPLGRYEEASAASQSALMLLDEMPPEAGRATRVLASQMLAKALSSLGRYDEAYQALAQAHEALDTTDKAGEAEVLRAFGALDFYRGKLEDSMIYLQRAYALTRDSAEATLTGTMTYLGKVAMDTGDPATAMLYFERVLEINYERGYHHYQVLDLRNIGLIYLNLMCYDRALLAFDEALAIQELAATEDNLLRAYRAICLMSMGHLNEGLARLTEAVGRGERDTYNDCLLHVEYVRGMGLADDPVHAHEQALALVRKVKGLNPVLYGRALLEQGRASHALRDPAALTLVEEALRHEKQYGGRDLWLCYDALAQMVTDTATRLYHLRLAAETLRHTGNTLIGRPDLQYAFLNHPRVKAILDETGI